MFVQISFLNFRLQSSSGGNEVDFDALEIAEKALTISHVVGILLLNLFVLFRVYKQIKGAGLSPRLLLILSLTCGDIFLALFPLIYKAKQLFDLELGICKAMLVSLAYTYQVHPFAYTIGLVTMCAEIMSRGKQTNRGVKCMSIVFSALPWALALIVALPLAVAGTNWEYCYQVFTLGRFRSQIIVCILAPAFLAIVMSIVVKCMKQNNDNTLVAGRLELVPAQTQSGIQPYPGQKQQYKGQQTYIGQQPNPGQQGYMGQQVHTDNQPPYMFQQTYPGQQQPYSITQPYPGQQQPYITPQAYPGQQQPYTTPQAFSGQQSCIGHQAHRSDQSSQRLDLAPDDIHREKSTLLKVSLIFFFLSLPLVVFALGYVLTLDYSPMDPLALVIVVEICSWLFYFRCLVTSACWLMALRPLREILPR